MTSAYDLRSHGSAQPLDGLSALSRSRLTGSHGPIFCICTVTWLFRMCGLRLQCVCRMAKLSRSDITLSITYYQCLKCVVRRTWRSSSLRLSFKVMVSVILDAKVWISSRFLLHVTIEYIIPNLTSMDDRRNSLGRRIG